MNAPKQPQPVTRPSDPSLQININSEDDAKAVIQHLGKVKATWDILHDTAGINSVEFCIAETIRKKVDGFLIGAVNWCRTYVKSVAPFEGNVHFPLPHFVPVPRSVTADTDAKPAAPVNAEPQPKPNRYLRSTPSPLSTPGKPERPVPAPVSGP